ncbi:MAG: metallophosphatase family protein [Gemmataceae bacterium]|nr:metallophosphatase family protein [Gemmataceae bacterium]
MRILLVADIHSNWPALQAINEPHDLCLCLGDVVDYGLEPAPCIDWVRQRAGHAVRGNHDHGAAQNVVIHGQSGFRYLTGVTRPLTRQLLSPTDRRFLAELPVTKHVTLDTMRFLLVHATPRDPLDEYAMPDVEQWGKRLEHVDADVVCVGHTHVPYVLEIGSKLVINPGSVGLPRDGDPRLSYAVMEGRKVELKRVEYPVETTVQTIQKSTLPDQAKDLLIEVYRNGEVRGQKGDSKVKKSDTKVIVGPPADGARTSKVLRPSDPGTQARPRTEAHAPKPSPSAPPHPSDDEQL